MNGICFGKRDGLISCKSADRYRVTAPSSALNPGQGKPAPQPGTQFVARQPILTTDEKVFGCELLFRDGVEDFFRSSDTDAASRSTLNTSILLGLNVLCDGRRAFVNCTRDILLKDYITLLPSGQTVVEVLESVPADDLVVAACRRLKEAGYMIALDDFAVNDSREALTDLADIIKVDVRTTTAADAAAMVKKYGPWRCRMLAEKVETREEFLAAKEAGFLEIPMRQVLDNVPLGQECKAVLLGGGSRLRSFYQLMAAQESGNWKTVAELTTQLRLNECDVSEAYWQAMGWARQVSSGV
jgi:c-di-GMP-related signal transduction protein